MMARIVLASASASSRRLSSICQRLRRGIAIHPGIEDVAPTSPACTVTAIRLARWRELGGLPPSAQVSSSVSSRVAAVPHGMVPNHSQGLCATKQHSAVGSPIQCSAEAIDPVHTEWRGAAHTGQKAGNLNNEV
jgi:hypothetical protein